MKSGRQLSAGTRRYLAIPCAAERPADFWTPEALVGHRVPEPAENAEALHQYVLAVGFVRTDRPDAGGETSAY